MGRKYLMVSGMAMSMPNWAHQRIHEPLYELPGRDKKEIGLRRVAKMETQVTHQGMVPSPLKNSLPFISFLEK